MLSKLEDPQAQADVLRLQAQLGAEVEANADLVKTQSSELGATFSGLAVHDVPINTLGGDVKEFSVYAPGTTTQQGGVLGSGGSIGGTRPRFNGFSIDGVDDNKLDTNGPTQPVIQESVAEFTLLTNQFSAENGHSAGGQLNIVTKSGTNNWHGAAWGYNRNRNYDAGDNLQNQRIDARRPAAPPPCTAWPGCGRPGARSRPAGAAGGSWPARRS